MKAVLDTNVLVSLALGDKSITIWLTALWNRRQFEAITSPAIDAEVRDVFDRPRVARRLTPTRRGTLLKRLSQDATWTPGVLDATGATPDPDDDMLVSAALETDAEFIVTLDKALLALGQYQTVRFVAPDEFISIVQRASAAPSKADSP